MTLQKALRGVVKVVLEEVSNNPAFAEKLETALGLQKVQQPTAKKSNRRTPAVLDPIALAHEGENTLHERLAKLNLEQLRDIVAEYGMDTGKLVMKWKLKDRVVEKIVEISNARAKKGDAFL